MSRQSTGLSRDERSGAAVSDFDADTVEEFAVRNRISRSQAYKEIAAGRLVARKIGARTIVLRDDAEAWRRALPTLMPVGAAGAA
jgi:hypothetical protein